MGIEEGAELIGTGNGRPVGLGHPHLLQPRAHQQLVLRVPERVRAGVHGDAGLHQRAQDVLRDVLVVERDDIDVPCEGQHGVGVAVVADGGGSERRSHPLLLGEHPDVESELDSRRDHHPCQLSAADHTDAIGHGSPLIRIHSVAKRSGPSPRGHAGPLAQDSGGA